MRLLTLTCGLFLATPLIAEVNSEKVYSPTEYVQLWAEVAMNQMRTHKIPASITLAQGMLESGNGNSELARKANNHFGIKCHDWTGEKLYMDDDKANECFRKYTSADASYSDHSTFLTSRTRYAKLFTLPLNDYKSWAQGLKDAGYATNPKYPQQLIELIERLGLQKYDELVSPSVKTGTEMLAEQAEADKNQQKNQASTYSRHDVKIHRNKINYIVVRKGDTFYKISKEFKIGLWQLYRYNDFGPKKDLLEEGDIVYLEPKRKHAREKDATVVVTKNMTWTAISQQEGIRLESLLDMNNATSPDDIVPKGQKVLLR